MVEELRNLKGKTDALVKEYELLKTINLLQENELDGKLIGEVMIKFLPGKVSASHAEEFYAYNGRILKMVEPLESEMIKEFLSYSEKRCKEKIERLRLEISETLDGLRVR